jgi:hypothetical protein
MITIGGESAGSMSVSLLTMSPKSQSRCSNCDIFNTYSIFSQVKFRNELYCYGPINVSSQ